MPDPCNTTWATGCPDKPRGWSAHVCVLPALHDNGHECDCGETSNE